jgi:outer membrane protein OmpA-like peptidoglycan-associated protein
VFSSSKLQVLLIASALGGFAMASTSTAAAQEEVRQQAFDLQLFTPTAAPGASFLIERPEPLRHLSFSVGLSLNGALNPFVRRAADGSVLPVVNSLFQGEVLAALGLFEFIELDLAVPLVLGSAVANSPEGPDLYGALGDLAVGASDLRVSAKVPLLRGDFALAARVQMNLPPCVGASCADMPWFASTRYWTLFPSLIAAGTLGPVRISGELGYRMRQRREIGNFIQDDEIHTGLGLNWSVIPELALIADAQFRVGLGSVFAGRPFSASEFPFEVDAGARITASDSFSIDLGVGTGLQSGYGAPQFRGFAMGRIRIDASSCAGGPEDHDGFMDGDFCLDPDNDSDGVEDTIDRCPNDAEDADGFLDDDGCPELDNDGDGAPDTTDSCPAQSEDDDEFQDDDGCPEPDNDEDGVLDGDDQCRMDPEDDDDFQDEDGCPEPGPRAIPVTVSDTRILIGETIYFEFDTEIIRPVSYPLLDQVAEVIGTLSPGLRIRVDGHTDNQGAESYNMDLSFRRARAVVEYLASRGVARDRLEYRGYGATHQVAPNDSPQGRSLNRRVEFTILQPGETVSRERRR